MLNLSECLAGRNTVNSRENASDKQQSNKKDGPTRPTEDHHGSSTGAVSGISTPSGMLLPKQKFKL